METCRLVLKLPPGKTGAREVAVLLLLLWALTSAYLFFWIGHDLVKDYTGLYSTLTTAVFAFAMGI